MAMAQMNISLPDGLKSWIEARVAEGRYSSSSDYVRDLVRREQEAEEKLRILRAAIEEGLASGISDRTIEDIIADGRARRAASRGGRCAARPSAPCASSSSRGRR